MAEEVPAALIDQARPPVAIALGSPTDVARTVAALGGGADLTCYQMDLYQAERLRAELDEHAFAAQVVTAPA